MSYEICTNCATEVSNPADPMAYVHLHTLEYMCDLDDLAKQGLSDEHYVACPTPLADDIR